ncbi:MAG: hypothetical protein JW783_00700, partial [Bacteroidales bacterium]|nr:hypothetical protein [Bacteroidales bacterium]MBN2748541.1 hypothetical protein [Bacteroidales bacterium]
MKQFYKLLAIVLIALMPSIVQGQTAVAPTVGDGSAGSPYEIATLENLYWIAEDNTRWGFSYKQTADIDASETSTWFSGAGWTPIGNESVKFTGTYNGSGFTINSLRINRPSIKWQALFGYTASATITNLGVTNVNINGNEGTASLVAANTAITDIVTNCYSSGTVISGQSGYPYYAGGLVALNYGTISHCHSSVNVTARQYLGGLVGANVGTITNSFAAGIITAQSVNNFSAGGFVGNNGADGLIENCYSTGNVTRITTANIAFGGFVGLNNAKIRYSYSTGKVIYGSTVQPDKGFCGEVQDYTKYEMTGNFWNITTSEATSTFGDAVGIATAQMQTQSTFTDAGWDFTTVWVIGNANNSFPQIKTSETPLGEGTVANPYKIQTLDNLNWVSQNSISWDKHFVQTANIDASETSTWNSGEGWAPIGNSGVSFSGKYDGQNHIISNLFINRPLVDNVGLFGITDGCTISNTHLDNANVTGRHATGAVVGALSNWSNLTGCSSSGTVNGNINVGGLVGANSDANIYNSYSAANVTAVLNAGGLVGGHSNSVESGPDGGTIQNCYTAGNVLATGSSSRAGGITSITRKSYIKNSYATGTINSTGAKGGVVGVESYAGYTDNTNFWDTQTTGLSTSGGQAVGKTTAEMKTATTFTSAGWDFTSLWGIGNLNNGYPFFSASLEPQGDGTLENPYKIQTLANLYWLSQTPTHWDKHFEQTSDIDASETTTWDSGAGWASIGNSTVKFTGSYVGNAHTITGLFINRPSTSSIGLFGSTEGASISYLNLEGVDITVLNSSAGLVGDANSNTNITGCHVQGNIYGDQSVGGIAGFSNNSTTIRECSSNVNLTGRGTIGGIVGTNYGLSIVEQCYSKGAITASTSEESSRFSGLVGANFASVINCYSNIKVVSGMESGGGLVGNNYSSGSIYNSYSTGNVSLLDYGNYIGGLVGINDGTVTSSYWDTEASGNPTSAAGIGKTTEEMKAYETFFNALWDFKGETANGVDDVWNIGNSTNDGYPYFNWTSPSDLAPQFITFSDIADKTYGDPSFELTASASSGLAVSFSSSDENVVSISGNTATIVGAGSVTIYANQSGNETYSPAQTKTKQITIAKALLSITAEDKSKSYDGSGFTAFTSTYSGFVNGEDETALTGTLTYTGTAATAVNGGNHTITPQGITSNNYEIDFVDGTLVISKVPLTITAEDKSKSYDGIAFTAFTSTYSGFVNSEDATVLGGALTYTGTAATATNAGTHTITPQGVTSDNYEITFADGSLEIGKTALTVTAENKTKTYDGSAFTTFTSTFAGLVNGEDETALTGTLTYTGTAATAVNAETYIITPQGVTSDNYEISFVNGSLEIGRAPLTVTADDKAKTYDGSAFTAFTSTYSGFVNSEDATVLGGALTHTGAATTATNAGTYTITPQGVTSDNYEISFVNGSLEIGRAPLTVTADDKAKTYDGGAFTSFTAAYSGFVNSEDATVLDGALTYTGAATTATNAGTYTVTPQGVTSDNYEITFVNGSLEIGKAPLTVTADDKAKTYDGSAFTAFTSTFSGLVNGE